MFKKTLKKTGLLILLLLIINSIYYYLKPKGVKRFIKNKDLEIIKENWEGNLKIGKEYSNGDKRDKPIMPLDLLKWKFSTNPQANEKKQDTFRLKVIKNQAFLHSQKDMIVWLGHASFFIRINGKTLLTDPVFGDVSFIKRLAGVACDINSFNDIDYILLSHGHRDHFDKNTLDVLLKNNLDVEVLIPLELNDYFDKKQIKNQQAGWYQKYKTDQSIEVFFMPAKHWNRRSALDFNRNLWGSFVIRFNGKTIYFSGDTSYGVHFKETSKIFGPIDYCLLSVGAYKPEIIMKNTHMSPTEALQAFKDLNGKMMIPMHFATYDLSDEPIGEPMRILEKEKEKYNIRFMDIGEELIINNQL
jgi:L-ascorbate metabolism protein UlaG (beta-lactamase superfamily)